jgi:hypothetical protein
MNCRTFQNRLEDYLENSLDFAGRFGMERHARQCIHCGREMADAQHLGQMVREIKRVQAPPDFEASVFNEIAARKLRRRFSMFRGFWVFGFGLSSWQKYALCSSLAVLLGLGLLYRYNPEIFRPSPEGAWAENQSEEEPGIGEMAGNPANPQVLPGNPGQGMNPLQPDPLRERMLMNYQTDGADYSEYSAIGPDNLPMIVPLPNTIRMQVRPPSQDYYIRNVSH